MGWAVEVSLRFTLDKTNPRAFDEFVAALRQVPEVIEIQSFLGSVDWRASVIARDMAHWQQVYRDRILTLPHIAELDALMLVATIKDGDDESASAQTGQLIRHHLFGDTQLPGQHGRSGGPVAQGQQDPGPGVIGQGMAHPGQRRGVREGRGAHTQNGTASRVSLSGIRPGRRRRDHYGLW